mmetsp:Transcript_5245/g.12855  ORF Transcript_5245/g.12855 Transcript_5245/m.12855 type:complete len:209 (-) Transcript_5245:762-1388(-)
MLLGVLRRVLVGPVLEGARTPLHTESVRILVETTLLAIKPQHPAEAVVPDRHGQDHAPAQGLAHGLHATRILVAVGGLVEGLVLLVAHAVGQGVAPTLQHTRLGVLEELAVLEVEAADVDQVAVVGVVMGHKLGDDGHGLGGVHREVLAGAPELLVTHPVRREAAAVLVAVAGEALTFVAALLLALTDSLLLLAAGVRRVDPGRSVGL